MKNIFGKLNTINGEDKNSPKYNLDVGRLSLPLDFSPKKEYIIITKGKSRQTE